MRSRVGRYHIESFDNDANLGEGIQLLPIYSREMTVLIEPQ